MKRNSTSVMALAMAALIVGPPIPVRAQAQSTAPFRIGVVEDFSGVYSDLTTGNVESATMAVEDFGGKVLGRPIEVVSADHQNKPDIGASIARKWYDVDDVKMIVGIGSSAVALAVRAVAREKGKVDLNNSAGTIDLTGKQCSPTGAHWTFDTYSLAKVIGTAVVKSGGDTWFFLAADYAFGAALERDTTKFVLANGGKVLGGVKHPLSTSDFASYLLQAQSSKAKVIGLANAGGDTVNAIKQAGEFGIVKAGQQLAGLLIFSSDVKALGLEVAQGLYLTESFYWDLNDDTRTWTARFRQKRDKLPNMLTAGIYSATLHYLKAVQAAGTEEPMAVMAKMRELPISDQTLKSGKLREDGRVVRDMYLFQVKAPAESKGKDDIYKLIATVPGNEAYRPIEDGDCPYLMKK